MIKKSNKTFLYSTQYRIRTSITCGFGIVAALLVIYFPLSDSFNKKTLERFAVFEVTSLLLILVCLYFIVTAFELRVDAEGQKNPEESLNDFKFKRDQTQIKSYYSESSGLWTIRAAKIFSLLFAFGFQIMAGIISICFFVASIYGIFYTKMGPRDIYPIGVMVLMSIALGIYAIRGNDDSKSGSYPWVGLIVAWPTLLLILGVIRRVFLKH